MTTNWHKPFDLAPPDTLANAVTLRAMAAAFGLELRAEHSEHGWAIWAWDPLVGETQDASDIAGVGATLREAIVDARRQLTEWERNA